FYDNQIDYGFERKVKPFSWKKAFPTIFKSTIKEDLQGDLKRQYNLVKSTAEQTEKGYERILEKYSKLSEPDFQYNSGGFDVVLGNPPYGALFRENEVEYFKGHYQTSVWRGESYLLFIEKAIKILKYGGQLGFIIPDTILNLGFTKSTRNFLLQNTQIRQVVGLPTAVFSGATVDTIILVTEKSIFTKPFVPSAVNVMLFDKKKRISSLTNPNKELSVDAEEWYNQDSFNIRVDSEGQNLLRKISEGKRLVSDIASMYSGIKVYELGKGNPPQTKKIKEEQQYTSQSKHSKEWSKFFDGKDIGRYTILWDKNNWIKYGPWLAAPRDHENFEGEKLLIRKITGKRLIATYVSQSAFCNTLLFVLKLKTKTISYLATLAILNSSLIGCFFRKKFQISDDDTFPQIMIRDILQFPIPEVEEGIQLELEKEVSFILEMNSAIRSEKIPNVVEQIQSRIYHSEERIDKVVYKLYQLTPEEIKLVEAATHE
ncbi:MAG: Eco57I restriction-modification methylase domain-containing protein, partial [Flammeovirgaceae bacterium]